MSKPAGNTAFFSQHAIRSVPWILCGKSITFFVYFAISVLLVRGLTTHQYGEYSLSKAIAEYVVRVAALGLNFTLLRFVPELILAKNLAGLKGLLTKTAAVQISLLVVLVGVLFLLQQPIETHFKIDIDHYALLIGLMALAATLKNFGNDVSTAIYQSRFLALISFIHSVVWLSSLIVVIHWGFGIEGVLLGTALAGIGVGLWNILRLVSHFTKLGEVSSAYGIGRWRVLRLAFPMLLNDMLNILVMNYTEVFFLGLFFTPTLVGYYDIGYQLPMLVITFFPLAMQSLFTSAFAEAYSKDKKCLPELVRGYFQILMIMTVPIACFGFFFATPIVTFVYGIKMLPAAQIVGFFSLFHMLTQFSIPPSMAINAQEKTIRTVWFCVLELGLAILLDILLIRRFGLAGALTAVFTGFFLTMPIRIWLIRRLVGGVYFPGFFFVRVLALCLSASLIVVYLIPLILPPMPLILLTVSALVYAILIVGGAKLLHLFNAQDVAHFRSIGLKKLDRTLDYFVADPK